MRNNVYLFKLDIFQCKGRNGQKKYEGTSHWWFIDHVLRSSQSLTIVLHVSRTNRSSRIITFSSFFSLRYSSFPFFSEDSSRGKRLRCSRAPLPPLCSSSSPFSPADWRAARAFLLRYSVRACGEVYLLILLSLLWHWDYFHIFNETKTDYILSKITCNIT